MSAIQENKIRLNGNVDLEVLDLKTEYRNGEELSNDLAENREQLPINQEGRQVLKRAEEDVPRMDPHSTPPQIEAVDRVVKRSAENRLDLGEIDLQFLDLEEAYINKGHLANHLESEAERLRGDVEGWEHLESLAGQVDRVDAHAIPGQLESLDNALKPEKTGFMGIEGLDSGYVEEVKDYDGNVELAGKVLETEWKIDNIEEYVDWESFSQGSLAGEAEMLLAELEEDERTELVKKMATQGELPGEESYEVSSVWEDRWGNLMGYDQNEGKAVKLVDSYDELGEKLEETEGRLSGMVEDARQNIQEFDKAALKALYVREDDYVAENGMSAEKLLDYAERNLDLE